MNSGKELYDLLDDYAKGKLSATDVAAIEERMKQDDAFRRQVEQHLKLVDSIKFYGERLHLKDALEETHAEMEETTNVIPLKPAPSSRWKKYWPLTAVAASVALISIVGTLLMTHQIETKQTKIYQELRRTVDKISQSQKIMEKDMAKVKEKDKPLPGKYAGTGFLISSNGYVVTSYHVVKEADSVLIENEKFGRLKTTVVLSDEANDISVLKIEKEITDLNSQPLPFTLARAEATLAEEVYTLGFPREDIVFGEGSISALTGYKQTPIAYQISVPVNPGNSGGPLLNTKGDLIGIVSGIETETMGTAFAIKSSVLLSVLDSASLDTLQAPLALPKQNAIKNLPRVQQVKRWKDFVFMIQVYKNN